MISSRSTLSWRDTTHPARLRRKFQSSRLFRNETIRGSIYMRRQKDFKPLASFEARQNVCRLHGRALEISILSPLSKRDAGADCTGYSRRDFYPLASFEARRLADKGRLGGRSISILSPLSKRDKRIQSKPCGHTHFNPLASFEARPGTV